MFKVYDLGDEFKSLVLRHQKDVLRLMTSYAYKKTNLSSIDALKQTYINDKPSWIEGYDIARYLPNTYNLAFHPKLLESVRLAGVQSPVFSAPKIPLRCDMPFDEKYDFKWHQDYVFNWGSSNSVTCWIPLQDTSIEMGALEVATGDYLDEENLAERIFRYDSDGVIEGSCVSDMLSKANVETIPVLAGEVLIFSQFLVHRSGKNLSELPRMSIQVRFSDLEDGFFKRKSFKFAKSDILPEYQELLQYLN